MKRLPIGVAVIAAATLALTGCSGGSSHGSAAASGPADPHTLHLAFLSGIGQPPDPDVFYGGNGNNIVNNVYEGLVRQEEGTTDSKISPWLATDWSASSDNTEWTFHLRKGVTFHDGTPLTSAAVAPSVERRQDVGGDAAGYMVEDVASVTTPDDYTAVFHLTSPNASFATIMASPFGLKLESPACLTKNAGSDKAQTYLQTHDCGSGPYVLETADDSVGYTMSYFDKWWGTKPQFTSIDYTVERNESAIQLKFDKGQIDAIKEGLTGSAFNSYKKKDDASTYALSTLQTEQMRINPTNGAFADVEFRQAFRDFIDAESLNKTLWLGNVKPATTIYGLGFLPGTDADSKRRYDPSKLKKLVSSMSEGEKTLTLGYRASSDTDSQLVNLLAAQLQSIGLKPKIYAAPQGAEWKFADNLKGAPDVFFAASYPDGHDPYLWAQLYWPSDGPLNTFAVTVPGLDDQLKNALATGDESLYATIGHEVDDMGTFTNLEYLADFMVGKKWLTGVKQAHDVTAPGYLDFTKLGIAD